MGAGNCKRDRPRQIRQWGASATRVTPNGAGGRCLVECRQRPWLLVASCSWSVACCWPRFCIPTSCLMRPRDYPTPVARLTETSGEDEEDRRKLQTLSFPDSICHRCKGCRTVATKTSKFLMCTVLPTKYPRQPVLNCPEFMSRG